MYIPRLRSFLFLPMIRTSFVCVCVYVCVCVCTIALLMHRYLWPHCRCISSHLLVPSLVGSGVGICIERDLRFKGWGRGVSGVALDRSIHCSDSRSVCPTGNIVDHWVRQYFKFPLCSKFSLFWCSSLTRIGAYSFECPEHFPGADLNILYFSSRQHSNSLCISSAQKLL